MSRTITKVETRVNVINLIQTMLNLRAVTFQSKDHKENNQNSTSCTGGDELVEWLCKSLPSTYSITRDKKDNCNIRIRISRHEQNLHFS